MKIYPLLKKAFDRRASLFDVSDTDSFRLFNGSGDGIEGLTLDRYNEYLLIQFFSRDLNSMRSEIFSAAAEAALGLPFEKHGILYKDRTDNKNLGVKSVLVGGNMPPNGYTVTQNGIYAVTDLINGPNTGIFLDARDIRKNLKPYFKGAGKILNLFCYTALFSVLALKCGAGGALNIDLSGQALEWAMRNYAANGLCADKDDFICGDFKDWLVRLRRKKISFLFALFDPPTFSRNKKRTFSVKRDYAASLQLLGEIVHGYVFTSINSLSVTKKEYLSYHPEGWVPVFLTHESSDFVVARRPYLKAGLWKTL